MTRNPKRELTEERRLLYQIEILIKDRMREDRKEREREIAIERKFKIARINENMDRKVIRRAQVFMFMT